MQSLSVPATLDALAVISDFIIGAAARLGLDERTAWQVQLAVDEAATNIIQHGYPPDHIGMIELAWQVIGDQLVVTLRDHGRYFDPYKVPPPNLDSPLEERQEGGLGIYLMGKLMDHVAFEFDPQRGNLLTMTKRIAPRIPVREIALSGRLDAVNATKAMSQVRAALGDEQRLLLDMTNVLFMSSSGLRALLLLRRDLVARGGMLRLYGLRAHVAEVFHLTGFTQVFAIYPNREEALASFSAEQP